MTYLVELPRCPPPGELCRIIGYRRFTPEERAGLQVHIPAQPVCPGHG